MQVEVETKYWAAEAVERYVDGISDGSIVSCKYVKLAVKRYMDDVLYGESRGIHFDENAASIAIDFFGLLQHSKGKWAGEYFKLSDWQVFILWNIFGWKNEDGTRRFRIAYNEVARKNGKSTFSAGIGLLMLVMDGEEGAEVYSAATKMEQAKIIHQEAIRMVRKSKSLNKRLGIHINNIFDTNTNSKFEPLGSDAKTLDGLNPHCAIVDELHAHPDGSIVEVIESAFGSRTQPLMFMITTAGFNTHCYCKTQREYAIKVLEGIVEDDTYFAIIYTLDGWDENAKDKDDWKDESVWMKANPNLGISVDIKNMRLMCKAATESPDKRNNVLVKKLNIWTTQTVSWVNLEKWNECTGNISEEDLYGKKCYLGIDLSSNRDLSGYGMVFPLDNEKYAYIPRFFAPKDSDNTIERQRIDRVPYLTWSEKRHITLTPGNVIDFDYIKKQLWEDYQKFDMTLIAYDRAFQFEAIRQQLVTEGMDEKKFVSFGQGFLSMSVPMKKLERIYLEGKLIHNNNPVMNWMVSNVAVAYDAADNIKPIKRDNKDRYRIDGVVMLIMGLGVAMTQPPEIDLNKNLREVGI
jgi:phage terminase large subunit-like protein